MLACKKRDFKNIDIFTLNYNEQLKTLHEQSGNNLKRETEKVNKECLKGTIRVIHLDWSNIHLKFSNDMSQVLYCSEETNLLLTLSTNA